jgi:hypothetical protein
MIPRGPTVAAGPSRRLLPSTLAPMPDGEQTELPADEDAAHVESTGDRTVSSYGVASATLGVLSVAAVAFVAVIWSSHHGDVNERRYLSRAMQTATDWTGVLINMNTDNVDASLQRLHDGTVGELNVDFDSAVRPYRQVVQQLKSRSAGRVEAVALESVRHDLDVDPAKPRPAPDAQSPLPAGTRTDTVMVIATSVAETIGGKPQTVHWDLRLDVSDVEGTMLISRLESIR